MDVSKIVIPGYDEPLNLKDTKFKNFYANLVDVVLEFGIDNTGNEDIVPILKANYDKYKYKTLYFRSGIYKVNSTIELNNKDKCFSMILDNNAILKAGKVFDIMINITGDDISNFSNPFFTTLISGGILDGNNMANTGICGNAWQNVGYVKNLKIVNMNKYGILGNSNTSSNLHFSDILIFNEDGKYNTDFKNILWNNHDTIFSGIQTVKGQVGFEIGGSGNQIFYCNALCGDNISGTWHVEGTIGFNIRGENNIICGCTADTCQSMFINTGRNNIFSSIKTTAWTDCSQPYSHFYTNVENKCVVNGLSINNRQDNDKYISVNNIDVDMIYKNITLNGIQVTNAHGFNNDDLYYLKKNIIVSRPSIADGDYTTNNYLLAEVKYSNGKMLKLQVSFNSSLIADIFFWVNSNGTIANAYGKWVLKKGDSFNIKYKAYPEYHTIYIIIQTDTTNKLLIPTISNFESISLLSDYNNLQLQTYSESVTDITIE